MAKFLVPVSFTYKGEVEIHFDSAEEAIICVQQMTDYEVLEAIKDRLYNTKVRVEKSPLNVKRIDDEEKRAYECKYCRKKCASVWRVCSSCITEAAGR